MPIPSELVKMLDVVHSVSFVDRERPNAGSDPMWNVDRSTASRWISRTMAAANIHGQQATARGLRHGFAIRSLSIGYSARTVAYWMGLPLKDVIKNYGSLKDDDAGTHKII